MPSVPCWLSDKVPASRDADLRSIPAFPVGFFLHRIVSMTNKLELQWLYYQVPGIMGSVLELVGLVSVHCDWVRSSLSYSFCLWVPVPEIHKYVAGTLISQPTTTYHLLIKQVITYLSLCVFLATQATVNFLKTLLNILLRSTAPVAKW